MGYANALYDLANAAKKSGDAAALQQNCDAAERVYQDTRERRIRLSGATNYDAQQTLNGLARVAALRGDPAAAARLTRQLLQAGRDAGYGGTMELTNTLFNLSRYDRDAGDLPAAAAALREMVDVEARLLPADSKQLADDRAALADAEMRETDAATTRSSD